MWDYSHGRSDNPMAAPAQRMIDFCNGVVSENLPETSYRPGVVSAPLHSLLPEFISGRLQRAFPEVNKHSIRGFFTNDLSGSLVIPKRSSRPRSPACCPAGKVPAIQAG